MEEELQLINSAIKSINKIVFMLDNEDFKEEVETLSSAIETLEDLNKQILQANRRNKLC